MTLRGLFTIQSTLNVVVMLDDKMATMGGVETLEKIRQNDNLCHVPVVMLMASDENYRKLKTYRMGANAYIVKPMAFKELMEMVQIIVRFWELAEPPEPAGD
ncbi:MAG: response regulator [Desulfobacterales bacterium]|nr:response regulator [Desulfobacterales bacterium]